jgi:NTE family protein
VQIENDSYTRELVPIEIKNLNDYLSSLYILIIENLNRNELTDEDWSRTISISSVGITPRIKKMSKEQKASLIESGRAYTAKYMRATCGM